MLELRFNSIGQRKKCGREEEEEEEEERERERESKGIPLGIDANRRILYSLFSQRRRHHIFRFCLFASNVIFYASPHLKI